MVVKAVFKLISFIARSIPHQASDKKKALVWFKREMKLNGTKTYAKEKIDTLSLDIYILKLLLILFF